MAVRAEAPIFRERTSGFKGKHHTEDARERMKFIRNSPEYKEMARQQQKERWEDENYAERMKDSYRKMWKNKDYRDRMLVVLAKARAKARSDRKLAS